MCCSKQEKDNNIAEQILDKLSNVEINSKEQEKIAKMLEYEYENQKAITIKTKMSVTEIKEMNNTELATNVQKGKSGTGTELQECNNETVTKLSIPKFLQSDEDIKITNAEKGTLVHLCMQKLDLSKKIYTYDDVKQLVTELEAKKIITSKEAEAININKVYQFTKSKIWEEMIHADVVEREKPFYINIPAKEIYNQDLDEKILVQGIIDLYYITQNDELVLVDFKTDFVENRDEQILVDKYKTQLDLYKRALESATGRKVDKVFIYSTYLEKEILICE